jgi:hypothetical protein
VRRGAPLRRWKEFTTEEDAKSNQLELEITREAMKEDRGETDLDHKLLVGKPQTPRKNRKSTKRRQGMQSAIHTNFKVGCAQ